MNHPVLLTETEIVESSKAKIGELQYGTMFRYNGTLYSKMKKQGLGNGVRFCYTPKHCLAYNPKLATTRELPGSTYVVVQKAEIIYSEAHTANRYLKDQFKY